MKSTATPTRFVGWTGAAVQAWGRTRCVVRCCMGLLLGVASPTWAVALLLKRLSGRRGRAATICWLNHFYLLLSVVAVGITLHAGNHLPQARPHWWSWVSFDVWGWFLLSRCNEVFYAFYRDAFDKLAAVRPRSRLTPAFRVRLALNSYAELILNFALLYRLLPASVWAEKGEPSSFADLLFYSASTITTSGSGRLVLAGWPLQLLTVYEILCGLILLVVCFAIYAGGAIDGPAARRRRSLLASVRRAGSSAAGTGPGTPLRT